MSQNNSIIQSILIILTSRHTRMHYRRYFRNIMKFLYEQYGEKFFLDYSPEELKHLIIFFDQQQWSKIEKQKHLIALKRLINQCNEPYLSRNQQYNTYNYQYILDSKRILGRTFKDTNLFSVKKTHLTVIEWKKLIEPIKDINPIHYIIFRLFESGCRIGGLINIQLKNLDLNIGFFDTVEKTGKCRYFIPDNLIPILQWYITRYDISNWLFPSRQKENMHVSDTMIRQDVVHKYTSINPHDFRRTMTRLYENVGASESDICLLLNHKPSMNALYSRIDPWADPKLGKSRYQLFWNKIFIE